MTKAKQAKYLAYSSRLAFAFKASLSLLLCAVLAVIARDAKNAFAVYFLLFPLIGMVTDSILYLRRDKMFKVDINDDDISETYGLNAEELVMYAKKIPLVRLLRVIPGMLMIPLGLFTVSDSLLIVSVVSLLMGYYPAALADAYFAKRLGVKLPSTYKLIPKAHVPIDIIKGTSQAIFYDIDRNNYLACQVRTYGNRTPIL